MIKSASFGFAWTNGAMVRPFSLGYFEQILNVREGTKGTILRFRLTTDVPR